LFRIKVNVTIQYRGQLATATGQSEAERELAADETLTHLIASLAEEHGAAFREIVLDAQGRQRRTLLVAIDGEQAVNFEAPIAEGVREITLMPPIAGG
jgi:molybdopterin converting factor small subunit